MAATLTQEHYDTVRRLQSRLADLYPLIQKMENCGLDCTDNRETAERLKQYVDAIEREFFSTGKPS